MGVGTRSASAARKAAPAKAAPAKTASRKSTAPVDEPDLLADLEDDAPTTVVDDDAVVDLLDGLSEDSGTPWVPDDEDDPSPAGIQGTVTYVGTVPSDYGPEECPLVELEAPDGTTWSVRGYSTVLRNQLNKADPAVGDTIALKYFGVKEGKGGREYKNFKVAIRHA